MAFPSLVQLPAGAVVRWETSVQAAPGGARYAYAHRNTPLRVWDFTLSLITGAELSAWKSHWDTMQGTLGTDTFTDPDRGTAHKARYAMPAFEWQDVADDAYLLPVRIEEVP